MSVWFKSRLNPWYIWIPSNPNLYSTKIIMKMRWQTIASNVSIRTISPTATPLPKAYDCVAMCILRAAAPISSYNAWRPKPPTKNLNSTARPYDEWTFSPLDFTAVWLSHLALAIYIFVVNSDALVQASDIRIQMRQVVSLYWMQDSNLEVSRHLFASRLNAHSQTDWAIDDQVINLNSTARPYDDWAFSPLDFTAVWLMHLALAIYMFVVVNFDALAQVSI